VQELLLIVVSCHFILSRCTRAVPTLKESHDERCARRDFFPIALGISPEGDNSMRTEVVVRRFGELR